MLCCLVAHSASLVSSGAWTAQVYALLAAHFCFNWGAHVHHVYHGCCCSTDAGRAGYYTLLAWLPSYFELALHLDVERAPLFLA